ncbi:MAG TPA: hypothetical protein VND98_03655 [Solirubrobacterales bacterium]|nr:hypothetical protein [Solirubrobacterales bacterium]
MGVAAPARKAAPAQAPPPKPAPARSAPPARKAAPRTARAAPARARPAPARAPRPARPKPKRAGGGQLIPLAVGRTASAVGHLPDSGLVVRMTRGRAWIGVLGVLLVGIVALNVITLSFAASSGKIYQNIEALEADNSVTQSRDAQRYGTARIRHEAGAQGLAMPSANQVQYVTAAPNDVETAARRLAAASGG